VERAAETYDLALMQRGVALDDAETWRAASSAVVSAYLVVSTARVLSWFTGNEPLISGMPGLESAIADARSGSLTHWGDVADSVRTGAASSAAVRPLKQTRLDVRAPLATPEQAHAFVVGVWAVDWVDQLNRLGYGSRT
jgi:hypothetical protein